MNKELRLTDEQYLRVLRKIEATIAQVDFKVVCSDCTVTGQKSTDSNCGFCNNEYTDEDMALFPGQYPERKTMKYREESHKCPFDMREEPGIIGWMYGCFYGCYLFEHLGKGDWNLVLMREAVVQVLEAAKFAEKDVSGALGDKG